MDPVSVHLFHAIAITLAVGHVYAPYFPIEISRVAASSAAALWTFRIGVWTSVVTLWFTASSPFLYVAWAGVSIVALFEDVGSLGAHFIGLGVLLLAAALSVSESGRGGAALLSALAIYALRLVLKLGAVAWYEFDALPMGDLPALCRLIAERHMAIVYRGPIACRAPAAVMPIFRISGLLQWAALYALSFAF